KALVPLSPREARAATRRARRRQPLPLLPSTLPPLERPQAKPGGRNDSGGGAPYLLSRARRLGRCHDRKEVSRVQRSPVARSGVGRTGSGPHRAGSGVSAGGDGKEARAQRGARKRRRKWRRARRTTFARRPVTLPSPAAQVPVQIRAGRGAGRWRRGRG
ncbi:Os06g0656201, partial [Oryza sativa Japonica Group]